MKGQYGSNCVVFYDFSAIHQFRKLCKQWDLRNIMVQAWTIWFMVFKWTIWFTRTVRVGTVCNLPTTFLLHSSIFSYFFAALQLLCYWCSQMFVVIQFWPFSWISSLVVNVQSKKCDDVICTNPGSKKCKLFVQKIFKVTFYSLQNFLPDSIISPYS